MRTTSEAFTFDDVLILPAAHSRVKSRRAVNPGIKIGPFALRVPIMTASMAVFDTDYVGDGKPQPGFARAVFEAGGVHVQSRGMPDTRFEDRLRLVQELAKDGVAVGFAVGLDEFKAHRATLERLDGVIVSIDIANGAIVDDDLVQGWSNEANVLMVGNFGSPRGVSRFVGATQRLVQKYSVGSGSACTTRGVTGVGSPNAWLIDQVAGESEHWLCIDGGIKSTSDYCKALALGADLVMMGRPFAATLETCSPMHEEHGQHFKDYFGMASAKAKGNSEFVEGAQGRVRFAGQTVADVVKTFEQAQRSAMSYVDAFTLEEYRRRAEVIRVSSSTQLENATRLDSSV